MMQGIEAFYGEISSKGSRYMRPGLETTPWGTLETGVIDPFGNQIRFCLPVEKPATPDLLASERYGRRLTVSAG